MRLVTGIRQVTGLSGEGRHPVIFLKVRLVTGSRQVTGLSGEGTSCHLSQGEAAGSEQRTGQKMKEEGHPVIFLQVRPGSG